MPRDFHLPVDLVNEDQIQVWFPMGISETTPNATDRSLSVVARLKPGRSLSELQAQVRVIADQLRQEQPRAYPEAARISVAGVPLRDDLVADVRPTLLMLMAAVLFVLLIACANVANLLLTRGTARRREMALRATFGAGRVRLVRQLFTESVLLASAAAIAGVVLALWALRVVLSITPAGALPRAAEVSLDWRVLLFVYGWHRVRRLPPVWHGTRTSGQPLEFEYRPTRRGPQRYGRRRTAAASQRAGDL
jgi:hypothetical protein